MKKFVYSDIDSSSASNLKDGTLYSPDFDLELRMKTPTYDEGIGYIKFVPNVLDSSVLSDGFGTFDIRVGNNSLAFVHHNNTSSRLLVIDSVNNKLEVGSKIETSANVEFSAGGIKFSNNDYITQNPVRWTLIADTNATNTAIPLPSGYATVADLLSGAIEGLLVAKVGNEYVSTVIPAAAVAGYPASFPIHKGGSEVGSFTFTAATDTTFTVTVGSADNVKVFMR